MAKLERGQESLICVMVFSRVLDFDEITAVLVGEGLSVFGKFVGFHSGDQLSTGAPSKSVARRCGRCGGSCTPVSGFQVRPTT